MITAGDIINEIDAMFPVELAMDWDTTQGLVAGSASKRVKDVVVSLEFRGSLKKRNADMFILHHPPIFGPKKTITNPFYDKYERHGKVVYSIHSRMDVAGFTSLALVEKLFDNGEYALLKTLGDGTNIIELKKAIGVDKLINRIKLRLGLRAVNAIIKKRRIKRIALHGGEAFQSHHISDAIGENIDLYLGGDMTHHLAEGAHFFGASFVDIGHFSEQEGMRKLCLILKKKFPGVRFRYVKQKPLWTTE